MPHIPLPLLILSAPILGLIGLVIFKYFQVRRARSWLAVPGKIVSAKSVMRKVRRNGADPGDDDTELRNFADIAYEFTVENHQVRGSRVSIGEDLGNLEVAETLARYPAGRSVTVYYNPANPEQAVLEREMPEGAFKFMTWFIVLLLAIVVLSVTGVSQIADVVRGSIPNPKNAPFVIGFLLFALFTSLIGLALRRQAGAIKSWPKTTGRIVSSDVEQFRSRETGRDAAGPYRTKFRQRVSYAYSVKGVAYASDRVNIGARTTSTLQSTERGIVGRYAPGSTVTVYFDPNNPSQAVLEQGVRLIWLLWLCVAIFAAAAYWFATTSGGKV